LFPMSSEEMLTKVSATNVDNQNNYFRCFPEKK